MPLPGNGLRRGKARADTGSGERLVVKRRVALPALQSSRPDISI
jgi:hypothetical protein